MNEQEKTYQNTLTLAQYDDNDYTIERARQT